MQDQFFWPIFGVTFLFGLAILAMVGNHLRASRKLKLREMVKEERIKAIEAGTPLPEVEDVGNGLAIGTDAGLTRQVRWLRLVALALGCLLVFTGCGMCLSFYLMVEEDMRGMAPIGLLPCLAGIGLLLFYWITREFERGSDAP